MSQHSKSEFFTGQPFHLFSTEAQDIQFSGLLCCSDCFVYKQHLRKTVIKIYTNSTSGEIYINIVWGLEDTAVTVLP